MSTHTILFVAWIEANVILFGAVVGTMLS